MKKENKLPPFWCVKADQSNPNWRKVIDYLKNVIGEEWDGNKDNVYYGYDGNSLWKGTNCHPNIWYFKNNPTVLTIEEFVEMTEGFVLPEKWCIRITNKNKKLLEKERLTRAENNTSTCLYSVGMWLTSDLWSDKTCISYTNNLPLYNKEYTEITFEQFKKYVMKGETMRTITHTQAQSIIYIACITWKVKLAAKWSKEIVLKETIEISDKDYQEMRNVCTPEQHQLFDEIFGKNVKFIPEGTPCLVRDFNYDSWKFAYSLGNGKFQSMAGVELSWSQAQVLDINNLPKYE